MQTTTTTTVLRPFFRDYQGQPAPEENFWTLWCKGRSREADTPTIRLGGTPSGLTSAYLHHLPIFLQAGCPSCRPTNGIKALKATSAFGLEFSSTVLPAPSPYLSTACTRHMYLIPFSALTLLVGWHDESVKSCSCLYPEVLCSGPGQTWSTEGKNAWLWNKLEVCVLTTSARKHT